MPPLPAVPVFLDDLGPHGAFPGFEDVLVRAYVVEKSETGRKSADEAATLGFEHREEEFYHPGFHEDVVVEKKNGFSFCALQKKLALLGDATRLAMMPLDGAATSLDHASHGPRRRRVLRPVATLARHHDLEVRHGLRRDPRERHRQGFGPLVGRDQNANRRQGSSLLEPARPR